MLVQRNLLQRDWPYLVMHDLVRDMGREIVRRESPRDSGKRSRLFNPQEGSKKVAILVVEQRALKGMKLSTKAFQKMIKLRVLKIDNLHISGDVELLSKELRWLSWKGCPLKCVPSIFPAEKFVVLNMRGSNIQEFGLNLQRLDLSDYKRLRSTPNFKGSRSLETLWLQNCSSLKEIHPSIGNLDRLICLMKQSLRINLECNEIPDWCSNKVTAPSICLTMPTVHNKEYKFSGMVLWFVYPLCDVILLQHFIVTVAYICLQLFHGLGLLIYLTVTEKPFNGMDIKGGEQIIVEDGTDEVVDHSYTPYPQRLSARHINSNNNIPNELPQVRSIAGDINSLIKEQSSEGVFDTKENVFHGNRQWT
ncbi:hypothetical protein KY289_007944 [Solanum tuberosum]|nr:hypothetical protein KY289_007944 [Solanum tuberosum]